MHVVLDHASILARTYRADLSIERHSLNEELWTSLLRLTKPFRTTTAGPFMAIEMVTPQYIPSFHRPIVGAILIGGFPCKDLLSPLPYIVLRGHPGIPFSTTGRKLRQRSAFVPLPPLMDLTSFGPCATASPAQAARASFGHVPFPDV